MFEAPSKKPDWKRVKAVMIKGRTGRIFFSRLSKNEDLVEAIKSRAERADVKAGAFFLIGTLDNAVLGFYEQRQYKTIRIDGPLEIASCTGNIAVDDDGETVVHAHIVVSDASGHAFGGHMMKKCCVGATAELILFEVVGIDLRRVLDKKTNLKLLELA